MGCPPTWATDLRLSFCMKHSCRYWDGASCYRNGPASAQVPDAWPRDSRNLPRLAMKSRCLRGRPDACHGYKLCGLPGELHSPSAPRSLEPPVRVSTFCAGHIGASEATSSRYSIQASQATIADTPRTMMLSRAINATSLAT